jgi:hypothetical protein
MTGMDALVHAIDYAELLQAGIRDEKDGGALPRERRDLGAEARE